MSENIFDLTGKVAVVTGSGRGLGLYCARALARAGADIAVTSRKPETLDPVVKELESTGRNVLPVGLDVGEYDSIQAMAGKVVEHFGRIDIFVNNAGCNIRKPSEEVTWDDWNRVVDTNLRGPFFCAQAAARNMIPRKWGRIINIGSVTSVFGYAGIAPYCASKGGIKQLTMSLADDWGIFGITVNCLAPGWFRTELNKVLYDNEEWLDYLVDRIPMKRPGQPHDLDGAVVFLASDASEYVTGQCILVDGGISTGATRATVGKRKPV